MENEEPVALTDSGGDPEFGLPVPPGGPHAVTVHFPGWELAERVRDGDVKLLSQLKSMYPRFAPWGPTRQLCTAIHQKLGLPSSHTSLIFASPDAFQTVRFYAMSPFRDPEHRIVDESELMFRVVDVSPAQGSSSTSTTSSSRNCGSSTTIRLYVVAGPQTKAKALMAAWQTAGTGVSTRLSETLLPWVEAGRLVKIPLNESVAESRGGTGGLPEGSSHYALRERICGLAKRGARDASRAAKLQPGKHVYLYPSGMAAILRAHQAMTESLGDGTVLVLGSVYKGSWMVAEEHNYHNRDDHNLQQQLDCSGGLKHFGDCSGKGNVVGQVEEWLTAEAYRRVSYCFVEFPSNPILVAADLFRLRRLADLYGFPVVVDDTVGSFANVDLLPVADVVVSSLTKSFSGYADVMGGSVLLNPASGHPLASVFASRFRNELFAADADRLLRNSDDYLARSAVLNRNGLAVASRLASRSLLHSPSEKFCKDIPVGIVGVNYPPFNDTHDNYAALMRLATADFTPGYGCLLSVDFATREQAVAFYDRSGIFHSPHLGAHRALALPFSELAWGGECPEVAAYHASYGLRGPQVRISVGLEDEASLLALVEDALAKAVSA